MHKSVLCGASTLALLVGGAPALAQEAPVAVEDLVVTAQRREQKLQDAPVAVSAFGAKALDQLQINRAETLGAAVPSLYVSQISASPSTVQVALRGALDQTGGMITSEPPVGIYVDDVYQARLSVANLDLADVTRVEVLRGPQGTLYGRNSMTGALKYVTRQPGDAPGGFVEASWGDYGLQRYRGSAGGRITDHVGATVSALFSDRDGWQQNTALKRRVGERRDAGARFAIGLIDTGPLSATFSAAYARTDTDGQHFSPLDPAALAPLAGGEFGSTRSPLNTDTKTEQKSLALHLGYDLSGVQLKSITAYQRLDDRWSLDFSGGLVTGSGLVPGFLRASSTQQEQASQELQALGEGFDGRLQWIGGLFWFKETGSQVLSDTVGSGIYGPFPVPLLPTTIHATSESIAAYGQLEWRFTDRLKGSAGLRWTRDEKTSRSNAGEWKVWTPKFNLQYEASDDVMVYGTIARGYRAGGFVALSIAEPSIFTKAYDPESAWSYEAGAKIEAFDRRARLNLAAYVQQLKDLQQNVISNGSILTQNAAEARIAGLEVEAAATPVKGLDLFASLALTDAEYEKLDPSTAAAQAGAKTLPLISKVQAQVGGSWRIEPEALKGGAIIVSADYSHRGPRYAEATNAQAGRIGSVDRVNASLAWESPSAAWRVFLQGRNVFDAKDYVSGAVFIPGLIVYRLADEPAMWSAGVKVKF